MNWLILAHGYGTGREWLVLGGILLGVLGTVVLGLVLLFRWALNFWSN